MSVSENITRNYPHGPGCDASVLLDDNSTFTGEKTAGPNSNSLRGFNVIDTIKSNLETSCPGVVSCADILAVAARDSVVALNGPSWTVPLGRRDSTTASLSAANSNLPGPNLNLSALITAFSNKGFTAKELVALSGSHTIGQARCTVFRSHIYNDANINAQFATSLKANCPSTGGDNNLAPLDTTSPTAFDNAYYKNLQGLITAFSNKGFTAKELVALSGSHTVGQARCTVFRSHIYNDANINAQFATSLKANCPSTGGDNNLAPLDTTSPTAFDNAYYKNLQGQKGLLHSDQELFNGGSTDAQVNTYSTNSATFFTDFGNAMVKMGNLSPLTGTSGQIRTNCRKAN
ncbi:hypothetical protein TEA_023923 [Camellia sinensis var. sinensis]|uniref:Peroxidase n=1 Tax=Camellia sinensis var. sinensis TaxID=542762 RepID=A0A4S4D1Y7_CAMSN|nr:hypothetical protein TEA_023923 [Camellia sinensis var. sinensis]